MAQGAVVYVEYIQLSLPLNTIEAGTLDHVTLGRNLECMLEHLLFVMKHSKGGAAYLNFDLKDGRIVDHNYGFRGK